MATLAGLPPALTSQDYHLHFLATSNTASALELAGGLVDELKLEKCFFFWINSIIANLKMSLVFVVTYRLMEWWHIMLDCGRRFWLCHVSWHTWETHQCMQRSPTPQILQALSTLVAGASSMLTKLQVNRHHSI